MERKQDHQKDRSGRKNKWGFWKPPGKEIGKKHGSFKERKISTSHSNTLITSSHTPPTNSFHEIIQMKKKYQNVPKKQTAEEEDKEVFDNVDQAHPVFSNHLLRPGKMKWKDSDTTVTEGNEPKIAKTASAGSIMPAIANSPDQKKRERGEDCTVRQVKRKEKDENSGKGLEKKIEKLEKENEELRKKLKEVKKILKKRKDSDDNSRESTEDVAKLSIRVLTIMKKNQVLDTVLDHKSNKILCSFFRDCEKPTDQVATLVEQAIVRGLKYMTTCSDQIDDPIDNEIRQFICNTFVAKKALLRALFDNPELVPDMWGGSQLTKKKVDGHDNEGNENGSSPKEKEGKN